MMEKTQKRRAVYAVVLVGLLPAVRGWAQSRLEFPGDTIELSVTIQPTGATEYGLSVFCDKNGAGFPITIRPESKILEMGKITPPFELKKGEDMNLRIFLDKGMVEVFVNDRQAAVYMQQHDKENAGISLFSKGGDITAKVKGWKMKSIYVGQ